MNPFLQLFTAMFVGFWATSAYFDHFLLTGVFCIAYGVVAEVLFLPILKCELISQIMSKHLYDGGEEIPTCELDAKKAGGKGAGKAAEDTKKEEAKAEAKKQEQKEETKREEMKAEKKIEEKK